METPFDIAYFIYQMFKDQYVCTSITLNTWYDLKNYRLVDATVLRKKFIDEYLKLKATTVDKYQLLKNLHNITFSMMVFKECRALFFSYKYYHVLRHDNAFIMNILLSRKNDLVTSFQEKG